MPDLVQPNIGRDASGSLAPGCPSKPYAEDDRLREPAAAPIAIEHFRTEHLVRSLSSRAVSGSFVTALAQAAKFILNLTAVAVLARLLNPRDFGLVGMVLGVTSLLGLFKDLGLSTATVQREHITQAQVSNLFWINVGLGGVIGLLGVALTPLVVWFYRDPRLTGIMVALSLSFVLTGSTVQHQALLTRQMRFKALAAIEVASMLGGIVVACILAWMGFSYWALVGQQLCTAAGAMVLNWWVSGWRPSRPARNSGVTPLVNFGAHLTASDLIARAAVNSDSILIGRFFGAESLGLYSRANVLLARPLEQILTPLSAVLIPVLSRLQSDPERYRRTYMRACDTLALLTFPFSALCLALAQPLVLLVLGPKWLGVVPLFAAFALVAVSLPLSIAPSWLFTSQGRGRDLLHTYVLTGAVTVAAYLVGLRWGPLGLILALAGVGLVIRMPILFYLAGRRGPVSTADLWKCFLAHVPCWGAVYLSTSLLLSTLNHAAPLVQVLVCAPFGLAGVAVTFFFRRPRQSAFYAWNTVRGSLERQFSNAH